MIGTNIGQENRQNFPYENLQHRRFNTTIHRYPNHRIPRTNLTHNTI